MRFGALFLIGIGLLYWGFVLARKEWREFVREKELQSSKIGVGTLQTLFHLILPFPPSGKKSGSFIGALAMMALGVWLITFSVQGAIIHVL